MKVGKDYYFHLYVSNEVENHGLNISKTLACLKTKLSFHHKISLFHVFWRFKSF